MKSTNTPKDDGKNYPISRLLRQWYSLNKRELPWRETTEPYKIWVSEIILQQTRVNQGTDYYLRFIARFPDAASLAAAPETDVLRLWQGLGYYSRARNLHAAAKQIEEKFSGKFPTSHGDILSLRGIGEYTAAAIASIAYNQPYAVVDGNVYRVLSRLFAIDTPINSGGGKKLFAETAQAILDPQHAAAHNQAIMDLGAVVCTPKQPKCDTCPLQTACLAHEKKETEKFPVKTTRTSIKNRYFHYFHIIYNSDTWICERRGKDIWENLYEFPLIETEIPMDLTGLQKTEAFQELFSKVANPVFSLPYQTKHLLSHRNIYASIYHVTLSDKGAELPRPHLKIPENRLSEYPVSQLLHKYLELA
ncbi:MAG: A/G-specific adenine glycosylase [Dysgonamonadaceae bacterium]|jgi:A/G-specific adenine glycosylase|nr:A/G-specific adenine glycosylase [Dysgonamonadaceae bacterium]